MRSLPTPEECCYSGGRRRSSRMGMSEEANKWLDSVIEHRRTVRSFKTEIPNSDSIKAIIHAGLWAPYAGIAITNENDFRRFFVIQNGNILLGKIAELLQQQARVSLQEMKTRFAEKPLLREKGKAYLSRVSDMAERGFPDLLIAPCLIVVAEQKGIPPAERQSLAHVVQNMWLKATALGIGLRLVSAIERLSENNDFCSLLGMSLGEFAFTGCIIGFAAEEPKARKRPDDKDVTKWM